jgi:hypothetical protein
MPRDLRSKVSPEDFAGICGICWEGSGWYEALGALCPRQEELALGKTCPIYACAKEHGVTQCGLCPEFPCNLLVHLAAEGGPGDLRIESAGKRAEMGDEEWAQWARAQPRKIWLDAFCPLRNRPPARSYAGQGRGGNAP